MRKDSWRTTLLIRRVNLLHLMTLWWCGDRCHWRKYLPLVPFIASLRSNFRIDSLRTFALRYITFSPYRWTAASLPTITRSVRYWFERKMVFGRRPATFPKQSVISSHLVVGFSMRVGSFSSSRLIAIVQLRIWLLFSSSIILSRLMRVPCRHGGWRPCYFTILRWLLALLIGFKNVRSSCSASSLSLW